MNAEWAYEGKRILITGSTGYIATCLVNSLKDTACHIVRLSREGTVFEPILGKAQIEDRTGDIRERAIWEEVLADIDVVIHLAADTSFAGNEAPFVDLAINLTPMMHLLEVCRLNAYSPTILFAGTVTQVGIPTRLPVDENHPDSPPTVYDLHKLLAEQYLEYYIRQEFVKGATLRLANVYGPGPASSSAARGVLNSMINRAVKRQTLTIYGQGNYMRDFVYIQDVAQAFLQAGANIECINGQHFVIGSSRGYTITEAIHLVVERVAVKTGQRAPVTHIEPPKPMLPIELRNFVADSSRFSQALGWQAHVPLEQGIDLTIDYFLRQDRME
jgi:nucleoside-diphosphate-sugar epimerase